MELIKASALTDVKGFLSEARPRKLRTMRQFAEEEIVLPSGPFAGSRFRVSRQPFTGLWFDQVDSGLYTKHVATGPTQSGKSLSCFIIPVLYHLFEHAETTVCGLPHMDMASDKWREDLLPIIERTRFKDLLPVKGSGSRGGKVTSVQFRNGATLKFMTGGGGDKSRAGFTTRVLVITETDGMDVSGRISREADKVSQLIARTKAFGPRARIYMECTVSVEEGRTWQEYIGGTHSRIALPCPHCSAWVTPEREHLVGWQEATTQLEARETGLFSCPECQEVWNESQRIEANFRGQLLHDGQSIVDGVVQGSPPATDTLGFRWSAVNNMFLSSGEIAGDEWKASRAVDEENADRERRQFVWCLPVIPNKWSEVEIQEQEITSRVTDLPRGIVPVGCQHLTAAIDLGKYLNHWVLVAWTDGPFAQVVDYGRIEVASDSLGVEAATMNALRQFRDLAKAGWPIGAAGGELRHIDFTMVDAGYQTDVVYAFTRESGKHFVPSVGRGAGQQHAQYASRVTTTGSTTVHVGDSFHINWLPAAQVHLLELNSDHWKTWVQQRLKTPLTSPGAMTLFQASTAEHTSFAKHLTAEKKTEEFIAGKGVVTKWERVRKNNHWFDALAYACVAAHYCGVRLVQEVEKPKPVVKPKPQGKPRVDVTRWRENNAWWRERG